MANMTSTGVQYCPDCGRQLETLWDYPSNEVWCLHCSNRFYRTLSVVDGSEPVSGCRLLLLDSDTVRRDALTCRFANLGFHITPVCHPRQALEAASFRHFDLAILSADWPGIDTSALIGKLRWQLGDVKFVVYGDEASSSFSEEIIADDIHCLRISTAQASDLESILHPLLDELIGKQRTQVARRWDCVPTN